MSCSEGPQRSDAGEARTRGPSVLSQAVSTTEPLGSLNIPMLICNTVQCDYQEVFHISENSSNHIMMDGCRMIWEGHSKFFLAVALIYFP